MAFDFVIALLLCSGDNCDLVRLDPGTVYSTYEACRDASEKDAARISQVAGQHREPGRSGDVICLRDITPTEPVVAARAPAPPPAPAPEPKPAAPAAAATAGTVPPPAPKPLSAREFRDCEQCPVMVTLPAGSFTMGSKGDPTERPPHHVAIASFALARSEVTEGEWAACVAASGCRYRGNGDGAADRPMTNLSWDDAVQYVQWLGATTGKPYRLPSEAEWEYAARAGTTTPYPWGDAVGAGKADCKGCGGGWAASHPAAATAFPANPWKLYGMQGGVAEWTEDCWHPSYAGAPANGSPWHAPHCRTHVLRGGSWMNPPGDVTVSSRNFYDTSVRYVANGLRVALSLR